MQLLFPVVDELFDHIDPVDFPDVEVLVAFV
jgi:hypothetical protein